MKITDLTPATLKALGDAIKATLPVVEGATIKMGGGVYDPAAGTATLKIKVTLDRLSNGKTPDQVAWESVCDLYDLKAADYDRAFTIRGVEYRMKKLMRGKFPLIAERADGKLFRFDLDAIREKILP